MAVLQEWQKQALFETLAQPESDLDVTLWSAGERQAALEWLNAKNVAASILESHVLTVHVVLSKK